MLRAADRDRRARSGEIGLLLNQIAGATMNILVLCTGNSARSILGEVILNGLGAGRITAFSAGSQPKGAVHTGALRLLAARGIDASGLHSKSWHVFTGRDAPEIDLAITVCGSAAGEACPVFPGTPLRAHWGLPDPAAVTGDNAAVDAAFVQTWDWLTMRANALLALPFETMARADLQARLADIGQMEGAA